MTIADVLVGTARCHVERGEALRLLQALPDACIDAVITDPPYSSGGMTRGDRMNSTDKKYTQTESQGARPDFAGDNRDQRSYGYWCAMWLAECLRVTKPGGVCCLFTDWRQLPTTTDALQAGGWVWRGLVPWDKTEASRPAMGRFSSQCEYVVWGSAGAMEDREDVGCLRGIFRHPVKKDDKHHQTGKPTPLMRDVVRICPPGGLILDPFGGSATTAIGALIEGRRALVFEIVSEIADKALARIEAATGGVDWRRPGQLALLTG